MSKKRVRLNKEEAIALGIRSKRTPNKEEKLLEPT